MNYAIVVASGYRGIPGYPALPSAQQSRVALASRLARSDLGFQCEQFDPQPGITQHVHDYLQSKADPESVVLFYFAGHLVLTAEGEAAFLLEGDQVCSVPFSRVLRALYGSFGGVVLVVDTMLACAVPNVDPQQAPQFVIDAIGPYLQQYGFGGIFAARPWGPDSSANPTPLAQLLVRACDRAAGQPTSVDRLVQSMQNDTEMYRQLHAFNAVLPHPDFYVLPGRQLAAQPALVTGALPSMPPPPPPVSPSILPPTDLRAHSTGPSCYGATWSRC